LKVALENLLAGFKIDIQFVAPFRSASLLPLKGWHKMTHLYSGKAAQGAARGYMRRKRYACSTSIHDREAEACEEHTPVFSADSSNLSAIFPSVFQGPFL
jgi:hypothetical protein